ncbi:unnamed protein product [Cuscuta epithymum]|uniref:Uncharacterized protein n=1 Tax=Cuscuta epithymum TaxID=186058 RepID=A0AAV0C079_9ASTE|nr:unnamed protein product [Cuscuta epithymum]
MKSESMSPCDFDYNGDPYRAIEPNFKLTKFDGNQKAPNCNGVTLGDCLSIAQRVFDMKTRSSTSYNEKQKEFSDSEQRYALKEKSNNVTEIGVPSKHGLFERRPSMACGGDSFQEGEAMKKCMVTMKVQNRVLQGIAPKNPTSQFQHGCHPVIDEIDSHDSLLRDHHSQRLDLKCSFENKATVEHPSRQVANCEEGVLFGDKVVFLNMSGQSRVSTDQTLYKDEDHFRLYYYVPDYGVSVEYHIQKPKQSKNCIYLLSDRYNVEESRRRVEQALKHFWDAYHRHLQAYEAERHDHVKVSHRTYVKTAVDLRSAKKWVNSEKFYVGHVPGLEIGDKFQFRAELAVVGLHRQFVHGINYVKIQGKNIAVSIVDSSRYDNQMISRNSFIYVGHGGNPKLYGNDPKDQKLICGNLALKNSMEKGVPVRVIRGNDVYVYEGLFRVTKCWEEREDYGKMAFKFELHRISSQPPPSLTNKKISGCQKLRKLNMERIVVKDLSQGRENFAIPVFSDSYADTPSSFSYMTSIRYPDWYNLSAPLGCICENGCSDSIYCYCAFKNGGSIPFNSQGSISNIHSKPVIYECGPSCKCPQSCRNRVSQKGCRYQLEVFRKGSDGGGWGVRSRDYISAGSFICELVGELVEDDSNGKGFGYRIDGSGFRIDTERYGNVGRFINCGLAANIYAQNVVYDDDYEIVPHVMFFASKSIPPGRELIRPV